MAVSEINLKKAEGYFDAAKIVYQVNPMDKSRNRFNVFARCAISVQLRNYGESLLSIGQFLHKDHASILHGLNKHQDRLKYDKEYNYLYDKFLKQIDPSSIPEIKEKVVDDHIKAMAAVITNNLITAGFDAIEIMNFWEDNYETELNKLNI